MLCPQQRREHPLVTFVGKLDGAGVGRATVKAVDAARWNVKGEQVLCEQTGEKEGSSHQVMNFAGQRSC